MKAIFITLFSIVIIQQSAAQTISIDDRKNLERLEKFLTIQSDSIINATDWTQRFSSSKDLIQGLVIALKTQNSFYYNFDSIKISIIKSPDSLFKIFTWQVRKDYSDYRQYGAIQMKTADGSLKLFPLFDASNFTKNPTDSIRDANKWIGAIYYKIILKTYNNKKYYTLLGSDENNERTNKKWVDVLTFDNDGKPQFGHNCFIYPNDGIKPAQPCYRFCIEYKKDAGVRIRFDEKLDEIVFDRVISEDNDVTLKSTLIPYGDYEAFRWINGKWRYNAQPFEALEFKDKPDIIVQPFDLKKEAKRVKKGR
jgi:hypothetical protein